MRMDRQLQQTLVGTGAVSAVLGLLILLAGFAVSSDTGRAAASGPGSIHWTLVVRDAIAVMLACVGGCVVLFGLLPMALVRSFAWAMRRWTGRD